MIPLSTTTVQVDRPTVGADAYELSTYTTVATGVPGHVSGPSGSEQRGSGTQESVDGTLSVGYGVDIERQDRVTDEKTGDVWMVSWTRTRRGLGLDRRTVGLTAVTGST